LRKACVLGSRIGAFCMDISLVSLHSERMGRSSYRGVLRP
jgi:hypothetical protein